MTHELLEAAMADQDRTVALRRRIHRHPELGNDLPVTKAAVLDAIGDLDLELRFSNATSGIVATLRGAKPGRTILLRGDMDALPMREDTGLEFASEVEGCMHACGHDAHTAMLAGAARLLHSRRDRLAGAVKFMFQPGEEGPGGAEPMMAEGLLEAGGAPDAVFALHVYPNMPAGTIGCRAGPILAAVDTYLIKITGRGGHASMPHHALDPVPVACEIALALQSFVTRRFDVFDPVVMTVGRIAAGTVSNVISGHAEMDLTVRSLGPASRQRALEGIRRIVEHLCAAHEMTPSIEVAHGYPPTVNDREFADFVGEVARDVLGPDGYAPMRAPIMGAEDFSYVLEKYPGAFAFIGAAPAGAEASSAAPCHSNHMQIDEAVLAQGVAMHAGIATAFLEGNSQG